MKNIIKKFKEFFVLPDLEEEEVECSTYEVTVKFAVPVDNAEYAINDIRRTITDKLNADYYDEECDFYDAKVTNIDEEPLNNLQSIPTVPA